MSHRRIDVGMTVVAKPPLALAREDVCAAEDAGIDTIMAWDHLQDFFPSAIWDEDFNYYAGENASPHTFFDYQTLLGYLAGITKGARLGVGVTETIRRHPMLIAQAFITLAHMCERPPILGIGAGERENTEPYGLSFHQPVGRLEEALQIIRKAFTSEGPFDFHGKHFHLDAAVLDLQPPPGKTPEIWVAAHGPRMLRLAGEYGDGWYPFAIGSPEQYAACLKTIRTAASKAGRDPDAITPSWTCLTVLGRTEEEARAMLEHPSVRFWGLLFPADVWQLFGVEHPFGKEFRGYLDIIPECYGRGFMDEAIAAVPKALMELSIWGTPQQVVQKLRAFGDAGLRHVVPWIASGFISREAAQFTVQARAEIAHALRTGGLGADKDKAS